MLNVRKYNKYETYFVTTVDSVNVLIYCIVLYYKIRIIHDKY